MTDVHASLDYPALRNPLYSVQQLLKEIPMDQHNFAIHTNGDTAKTLKEAFMGVLSDVSDVETALRECAPNMRNYYPLPNAEAAFDRDRSAFIAQMKKLEEIKEWATAGAMRAIGEKA